MKARIIKVTIIVVLLFAFTGNTLYAQQVDRLSELSQKIQTIKDAQILIDKDIKLNQEDSKKLAQEISKFESELELLSKKKIELESSIRNTEQEITDTSFRISDLRQISNKRLKAFYVASDKAGLPGHLTPALNSVSRYMWYFQKIRNFEIDNSKELSRLETNLQQHSRQLEIDQAETEKALSELAAVRLKITQHKHKMDRLLTDLKRKKFENTRLISQFRAETLRIETAISSLSLASEDSESNKTPESEKITIKEPEKSIEVTASDVFAEKLLPPVDGLLVSKFGTKKSDTFGQKVASKGLGFAALEGSDVKCVARGKVVFAGNLGDYGQVVIVDHANRVHTLYSLLTDLKVSLGQELEKFSVLGKTAKISAALPYNLYFELRIEGHASNPEEKLLIKN